MEKVSDNDETSFLQEAMEISEKEESLSSDLKEFGVDTNEPDLFSSYDKDLSASSDLLGF